MKNNRLLHAIGRIDDTYVTEAVRRRTGKTLWLRVCAVAACVALLVGGGAALYNRYSYPDLPMLTIPKNTNGAHGGDGFIAYSFDELKLGAPWNPDSRIRTLPVYDNSRGAELHYADDPTFLPEEEAAMKQAVLEKAALLGMDTSTPEFQYSELFGYYLSDDWYTVSCSIDRLVIRTAMPEGYTLDPYATYDELYRTAQYLLEEYRDVIGMKNPIIDISMGDYSFYGEKMWLYIGAYEQSKKATKTLYNDTFSRVSFANYGEGQLGISFNRRNRSNLDVIGEYPIITADEAQALLEEGYYVNSEFDTFPGVDTIRQVSLVYKTAPWISVFIPYYVFYVEEPEWPWPGADLPGMKCFNTYYVPAVDNRYIEGLPVWDGTTNK